MAFVQHPYHTSEAEMAAITFAKLQGLQGQITNRQVRRIERRSAEKAWERAADAKARRLGYPTNLREGVCDLVASILRGPGPY